MIKTNKKILFAWAESLLGHPFFMFCAVSCISSAELLAQVDGDENAPLQLERITVTAPNSDSGRKQSSAAKFVVTREDLSRFGDTNVADVLERIPGVTVSGAGGQAKEIRLRGLGGGYTQLLINGEPVASEFSIGSISPDVIERIEIIRSATADSSAQAIAGSINFVLKSKIKAGTRELKLTTSSYTGLGSGSVDGQFGDSNDAWSYSAAGGLKYDRDQFESMIDSYGVFSSGDPLFARITQFNLQRKQTTFDLAPRVTWKSGGDGLLSIDGLLQVQRTSDRANEGRTSLYGVPPEFARNVHDTVSDVTMMRVSTGWKSPIGKQGEIDVKLTSSLNQRGSTGSMKGYAADSSELVFRTVDSQVHDHRIALTGKYTHDIGDGHVFGAGWDGEIGIRRESRIQHESSNVGYPIKNIDEDYEATVGRVAFYAQDEWAMSSMLSIYLGLRWEGLETKTNGNLLQSVKSQSNVFSPTMQLLWKIPETDSDQVRVSISRTYKAPTAKDLIPRRWVNNDNSATQPNFQGNPTLIPELAWGMDIGYERYLSNSGFIGVNAYTRLIDNIILLNIDQDNTGTWISTPKNNGKAKVFGVEFEAKGNLKSLWSEAPNINLRSGLARNMSYVERVPGPGNRLSQQPSLTGSLGAEFTPVGSSLTFGGDFLFEKGDLIKTSERQSIQSSSKRSMNFYSTWVISNSEKLKIVLTKPLQRNQVEQREYFDGVLTQGQIIKNPEFYELRIVFEAKI